mgnify:CR=1 FL=1
MTEEMLKKSGEIVYATICKMFDNLGYHYERHDDDLVVSCTVKGEDIPMDILFIVRSERQLVQLLSPMPFTVPEDKRMEMAIAVTAASNNLVDGSFDFDLSNGRIVFRQTSSYMESILGEELFTYMLMVSARTIDDYNDKFLMLAKGMMTLDQFIEKQ